MHLMAALTNACSMEPFSLQTARARTYGQRRSLSTGCLNSHAIFSAPSHLDPRPFHHSTPTAASAQIGNYITEKLVVSGSRDSYSSDALHQVFKKLLSPIKALHFCFRNFLEKCSYSDL